MNRALLLPLALATAALAPVVDARAQSTPASVPAAATDTELYERARALAAGGQREEAIRLYGELLARKPGHVDARLARGRTFAWMKRWPEAEADLRAVTAASPTYADAWSALGDMYLWSDRPREAADAYGRWQALRPQDAAPLLARSRALRGAGDAAGSRAAIEAARGLGADAADLDRAVAALEPRRVANPETRIDDEFDWSLRLDGDRTSFSSDREDWTDASISLRRRFDRGSVALELLHADRYGSGDQAWAVDAYVDAWERAYANLRFQHAPDARWFPRTYWRAELFQGFGRGWEGSVGFDQQHFSSKTNNVVSVGLGRYVSNFYVRGLARHSSSSGNTSYRGLGRYYYRGNGDEYVELTVGSGRRDAERIGLEEDDSDVSLGVAFTRYFTPQLGMKLNAGYFEGAPSGSRVGASLYYRW